MKFRSKNFYAYLLTMTIPVISIWTMMGAPGLNVFKTILIVIGSVPLFSKRSVVCMTFSSKLMRIYIYYVSFLLVTTIVSFMLFSRNDNTSFSFQICIASYLKLYILSFIATYVLVINADIEKFLKIFKLFGLILCVLGLVEKILNKLVFSVFLTNWSFTTVFYRFSPNSIKYRMTLLFAHPIICGVFFTVIWIIFCYFPYKNRIINIITKSMILFVLYETKSRSSWIAFIFVNFILVIEFLIHNKKLNIRKVLFSILIPLCGVMLFLIFRTEILTLWNQFLLRMQDGIGKNSNSDSKLQRLYMIKNYYYYAKDRNNILGVFFGKGFYFGEQFLEEHPLWNGWIAAVDNQFLTILFESGIVGLFLFMYMIFQFVYIHVKSHDTYLCCFSLCLISMIISSFFYEMFNLAYSNIVILFFCMLIFLIKKRCILSQDKPMYYPNSRV